MTAIAWNSFSYSAGQDMDMNLTIVDSAGVAVDLTGAAILFKMVPTNDRANPVADTSDGASPFTASYTITDAEAGEVTIVVPDTVTAALIGDYYYEVKVTDSSGDEGVTNRGVITFEYTIT